MRVRTIIDTKCLLLAAVVAGLLGPGVNAVRAEDWQIRLERLRVQKRQESGGLFGKSGDEPYLIVIGFRSTFNTPGSTRVWRTSINGEFGKNMKSGAEVNIPENVGKVDFKGITFRSDKDIAARRFPEVVGVIVVAMESDGTPWTTMRSLADRLVKQVEGEVRTLIERGKLRITSKKEMDEDIAGAVARVRSKVKPKGLSALGSWLRSWTDPDDLIGLETMVFAAVQPGLVKADRLEKTERRIGGKPLVFSGDDAVYHVTAMVRKVR